MSQIFRTFLKKIASGPHTGSALDRHEAELAMQMMLQQEATPAQIGAFLVAHRLKRPTSEELAGMLDAYDRLSQRIPPVSVPLSGSDVGSRSDGTVKPIVLGCPYDGRDRTAPVTIITALMLATVGQFVILHGGDRIATKYGIPLVEICRALALDWTAYDAHQLQTLLATCGWVAAYTPRLLPEMQAIAEYRDQIGKRPPLATLELMWSPYASEAHIVAGFVHPPTENFIRGAFALRQQAHFTLVKGLEGSCDLPRSRTAIISTHDPATSGRSTASPELPSPDRTTNDRTTNDQTPPTLTAPDAITPNATTNTEPQWQRLYLHARDFDLGGTDLKLESETAYFQTLHATLRGEANELTRSAIWSGGFYLWRSGVCATLGAGLTEAEALLTNGAVLDKLQQTRIALNTHCT